jgi:hypothetical protein
MHCFKLEASVEGDKDVPSKSVPSNFFPKQAWGPSVLNFLDF